MQKRVKATLVFATLIGAGCASMMGSSEMTFFVTSAGPGRGAG